MSGALSYGTYGVQAERETAERQLTFGKNVDNILYAARTVASSTLVDAGSTPTTKIRPGLLLAKDSNGELVAWDPDAAAGQQDLFGVNRMDFTTLDQDGVAIDKNDVPPPIVRAQLRASQLLIEGNALVGSADEFFARRALHAMGCVLDDDLQGWKAGVAERQKTVGATTDTLTTDENGYRIHYNSGSSVTVTMPAVKVGLSYTLMRTGNEEFIVTSAEGDNFIVGNDLSADSVTFTTASEHLGAGLKATGVYHGTAPKWLIEIITTPFGTDLSGLTYGVAT